MRSTFEVGDPSGRGVSYYGPATTVRIHPSGDECSRLALLEQTPLLSIDPSERPLSCPLPTLSDVLGALSRLYVARLLHSELQRASYRLPRRPRCSPGPPLRFFASLCASRVRCTPRTFCSSGCLRPCEGRCVSGELRRRTPRCMQRVTHSLIAVFFCVCL